MELFHLLQSQTAAICAILVLLISLLYKSNRSKKTISAPEAGGSWPVIGHLHLLRGPEPAHRVLAKMADNYGPIFTIKMGVHRSLVISNWKIAKECFTTNDKTFANRPKTMAMELLGYNFSMIGFSPYGPYLRQARKIATHELLSNYRLDKLKHVRESEVKNSLKEIYELWNKKRSVTESNKVSVEMIRLLGDVTLNVIMSFVVGKRCAVRDSGEESEAWKDKLTTFFVWTGKFSVSDALPFLRLLDIGGDEKSMKKIAEEFDVVAQEWMEEHKRKRESKETVKEDEDFMDVMLSVLEDNSELFPDRDADTVNKAICFALILAAGDTMKVTLTWVFSLLLNHPDVLKKAQRELDTQVGSTRHVMESDLTNLVYLHAIIKEAMRLYPASPLALPHECLEDCSISGYHVPKGTRLIVNLWKLHRDPDVWSNPCEFRPERFLGSYKNFDVRGQNFEYIPFGSGRRMCPGVTFALQVIGLVLASLLHGFEVEPISDGPVDMTEDLGLTYVKKFPLDVLLSPRLSASLFV